MVNFFDQLLSVQAQRTPHNCALKFKQQAYTYAELQQSVEKFTKGLLGLGLQRQDRVAIFLPKLAETVISFFAASAANGTFVPVNAILKPPQVKHILLDCDVKILITSSDRLHILADTLNECTALRHVILVDKLIDNPCPGIKLHLFSQLPTSAPQPLTRVDNDMTAILYTSGSTGKPKGVVLSHRNLVCGAKSVSSYLENHSEDVILALLPLSFDYGLSQITTAFYVGACCVLLDYFLVNDVVKAMAAHQVTGLAAVPPLWQQLLKANWPENVTQQLRYFTNSGGAMPQATLQQLRDTFPNAAPYLMYGLTEAFRSTYLPPDKVDERPGSMGKAIPNAEIMVIDENGQECQPDQPGELVHRGPHVSLGYWNDEIKTRQRFKPIQPISHGLVQDEIAVWSGDTVKKDKDGYLYFVGRNDEMIKTSGYRVSPMEIEQACYASAKEVAEAVAIGVADNMLGQAIALLVVLKTPASLDAQQLLSKCKKDLPNFMHPKWIEIRDSLPRNPNGKVDRSALAQATREKYTDE